MVFLLFRIESAASRQRQRLRTVAQVATSRLKEIPERVANIARKQAIEERIGGGIGVCQPKTKLFHLLTDDNSLSDAGKATNKTTPRITVLITVGPWTVPK